MKYLSAISAAWLLGLVFFVWGVMTVQFQIFPWSYIASTLTEMTEFAQGGDGEDISLFDKLQNDLGLSPERQMGAEQQKAPKKHQEKNKQQQNKPLEERQYRQLSVEHLSDRREMPEVFADEGGIKGGYLFILGTFDFEEHLHGAILLNDQYEVVHRWYFDEAYIKRQVDEHKESLELSGEDKPRKVKYMPPPQRFPHGMDLYEDGSVVVNDGDPGNLIQRIDYCSKPMWSKVGGYNHSIHRDLSDDSLWVLQGHNYTKLSSETGERLKFIKWDKVRKNNRHLDFDIRLSIPKDEWLIDPWHPNDIDPLSPELAHLFPRFSVGDLLISLRSLNMILILDPDSLDIKWWRMGMVRRQHDPDWNPNGKITVFNNNYTAKSEPRRYSTVVEVDPDTDRFSTLYDGELDDVYTDRRGKHQLLPNGNILITSANQGRVVEVTAEGRTVFDFKNRYNDKRNLLVSEARWVPASFFSIDIEGQGLCTE